MQVLVSLDIVRDAGPPRHVSEIRDSLRRVLEGGLEVTNDPRVHGSHYQVSVLSANKVARLPEPITVGGGHPDTSHKMAERAKRGEVQALVLEALYEKPDTDDGLEVRLNRAHQSVSATRNGLVKAGLATVFRHGLTDEPVRAQTRYGNDALVWDLTPRGRQTVEWRRKEPA